MVEFEWLPPKAFGGTGFETEWITVRKAQLGGVGAPEALEKICRTYWYPLYVYVRGKGYDLHEAQDLTQEFFSGLLAKSWLEKVDPSKGRFRAFLLAAMNHFLKDEWRRENAAKRGGGREVFSLDALAAEQRFNLEPHHHESPDRLYDYSWAVAVAGHALDLLRAEFGGREQTDLFDALKHTVTGGSCQEKHTAIAKRLGLTPGSIRKTAQRLRERYQELLRSEIALTVSDPAEMDDEIRHIVSLLDR